MNKFNLDKIANVAIGMAAHHPVIRLAFDLQTETEKDLATLAAAWQMSLRDAEQKAIRIKKRTGFDPCDILVRVMAGVRFDD